MHSAQFKPKSCLKLIKKYMFSECEQFPLMKWWTTQYLRMICLKLCQERRCFVCQLSQPEKGEVSSLNAITGSDPPKTQLGQTERPRLAKFAAANKPEWPDFGGPGRGPILSSCHPNRVDWVRKRDTFSCQPRTLSISHLSTFSLIFFRTSCVKWCKIFTSRNVYKHFFLTNPLWRRRMKKISLVKCSTWYM